MMLVRTRASLTTPLRDLGMQLEPPHCRPQATHALGRGARLAQWSSEKAYRDVDNEDEDREREYH